MVQECAFSKKRLYLDISKLIHSSHIHCELLGFRLINKKQYSYSLIGKVLTKNGSRKENAAEKSQDRNDRVDASAINSDIFWF